ncbi:tryptophan halogenase family protein [Catenovulum sp. SX2]|uniref:tryptophan halogenase family protein n=1 Tax=Catenovulum sp. SX2 TaxID=3398614 RepID=UPI003F858163
MKFVIVGGGMAGWMSAALLAKLLKNTQTQITLVESPLVGSIGVGEATVPSYVDFLQLLGIDLNDFVVKTNATYKLGIEFINWNGDDKSYWHPFGGIGCKIDGQDFFQHWLKSRLYGNQTSYSDFSPSAKMAQAQKFYLPNKQQPNNLSTMGYALHFDASLAANYLAEFAQQHGVQLTSAHVEHVQQHTDGSIQQLVLQNGQTISGDFFIDCSGQQALLLAETLGVGYVSWQNYLPVNCAIALQTSSDTSLRPYTQAIAMQHGWRWNIPLRNRQGNGYVFSNQYCCSQQAIDELNSQVTGKALTQARLIEFTTGKRSKMWAKNCIALGLASGFLEPLESTSIYLIMKGILNFAKLLPNKNANQANADEYNRLMAHEYQEIRDFIVAHYCTSKRNDSKFWRSWQTRNIPDSLRHKLELYSYQGHVPFQADDIFQAQSWHCVLTGMGKLPQSYQTQIDASDFTQVNKFLDKMAFSLEHSVKQLLTHQAYLERITS